MAMRHHVFQKFDSAIDVSQDGDDLSSSSQTCSSQDAMVNHVEVPSDWQFQSVIGRQKRKLDDGLCSDTNPTSMPKGLRRESKCPFASSLSQG